MLCKATHCITKVSSKSPLHVGNPIFHNRVPHFNGQIHHHHTTSQQIAMKFFTSWMLHMQFTPPPRQPKRKRRNGPFRPNGDPRPPSSDSSVQTSSQTSHRNHQSHHLSSDVVMAIMACPKTWWNLHPVKTTRNTMGEIGNFQKLMNAWKESLWCSETPTRQSIMQHFGDWEKIDKQTYQKN